MIDIGFLRLASGRFWSSHGRSRRDALNQATQHNSSGCLIGLQPTGNLTHALRLSGCPGDFDIRDAAGSASSREAALWRSPWLRPLDRMACLIEFGPNLPRYLRNMATVSS